MKFTLKFFMALLLLLLVPASVNLAMSGVVLYLVAIGDIQPGEPIWIDELAPATGDAFLTIAKSLLVIAGVIVARWQLRKFIGKIPSNPTLKRDAQKRAAPCILPPAQK